MLVSIEATRAGTAQMDRAAATATRIAYWGLLVVAGGCSDRVIGGGTVRSGDRGCSKPIGSRPDSHARQGALRSCSPFAAPIVVADQGPDTFDKIALGAKGIQMGRVPSALSPHRGPAVAGPGIAAVIKLAAYAFFHVDFPPV